MNSGGLCVLRASEWSTIPVNLNSPRCWTIKKDQNRGLTSFMKPTDLQKGFNTYIVCIYIYICIQNYIIYHKVSQRKTTTGRGVHSKFLGHESSPQAQFRETANMWNWLQLPNSGE